MAESEQQRRRKELLHKLREANVRSVLHRTFKSGGMR